MEARWGSSVARTWPIDRGCRRRVNATTKEREDLDAHDVEHAEGVLPDVEHRERVLAGRQGAREDGVAHVLGQEAPDGVVQREVVVRGRDVVQDDVERRYWVSWGHGRGGSFRRSRL